MTAKLNEPLKIGEQTFRYYEVDQVERMREMVAITGLANSGLYAFKIHAERAVDDLSDLIEWLREDKHYPQADRLRTIRDNMAKALALAPTRKTK